MIGRFNIRPARFPLALPPPSPRKLSHTRTVVYQGFDREDGLWDIEAELTDVKTYGFSVPNERPFPANEPIHGLKIRVTLNNKMVIQDIVTAMDDIPHPECAGAPHGMTTGDVMRPLHSAKTADRGVAGQQGRRDPWQPPLDIGRAAATVHKFGGDGGEVSGRVGASSAGGGAEPV